MRARIRLLAAALALVPAWATAQEAVLELGPPATAAEERLVIHGSTDIGPFRPVLEAFVRRRPGLHLRYEQRGTNDIYDLAAAGCSDGEASADLLISSSIDQQIKLANDGCASSHSSDRTDAAPEWAKWRGEVFGLTVEMAVIVYNKARLAPDAPPRSRFDLIDLLRLEGDRFVGRVATYDIERSGLGYLFAFADGQESATYGQLIEAFGRNAVVATCCSAEIIDRVASGEFLIAYNMLGSYALARARQDDRIGVVAPADYTLVLSRAALVPKHAANGGPARALIDFALSEDGKRLLADAALIVDLEAEGREVNFRPISLRPSLIVGLDQHKRARFLRQWRRAIEGGSGAARAR